MILPAPPNLSGVSYLLPTLSLMVGISSQVTYLKLSFALIHLNGEVCNNDSSIKFCDNT